MTRVNDFMSTGSHHTRTGFSLCNSSCIRECYGLIEECAVCAAIARWRLWCGRLSVCVCECVSEMELWGAAFLFRQNSG
jgi:hypothetical protein